MRKVKDLSLSMNHLADEDDELNIGYQPNMLVWDAAHAILNRFKLKFA